MIITSRMINTQESSDLSLKTEAMLEQMNVSMSAASQIGHIPHPFYPLGVEIVGYLANRWSVSTLLGTFLAISSLILGLTWALVSWTSPKLRRFDKLTLLWFILSKRCYKHH